MKTNRFIALLVALLMVASIAYGCAKSSDPEDVLAVVDGTKVYRWYYNIYHDQQLAMYLQYMGKDYTAKGNEAEYKQLKVRLLEDIIARMATLNKAMAEGYGELSEEEKAQLESDLQKSYEETIQTFMDKYPNDPDARAKAEADYQVEMEKKHLTLDKIRQDAYENYIINKFMREYGNMKDITDEELLEYYDQQLEAQQKEADEGADILGEGNYTIRLVYPEGYKLVKILAIPYTTADQTTVALNEEAVAQASLNVLSAIDQYGEDSKQAKSAQAALEKAAKAYENALKQASDNVSKITAKAVERVKNGETLEAVFESLKPDATLYWQYVREDSKVVSKEVVQATFALQNVGDVSDLLQTADGCAFIQLVENVQAKIVPLEEVREAMVNEIELNKYYMTQYSIKQQCVSEAKSIIRYEDKL